jgi:hypothetical protein
LRDENRPISAFSSNWHGLCNVSGMTRRTDPKGRISGRIDMTSKFNSLALSIVSALLVATVFVGAAVGPATPIAIVA